YGRRRVRGEQEWKDTSRRASSGERERTRRAAREGGTARTTARAWKPGLPSTSRPKPSPQRTSARTGVRGRSEAAGRAASSAVTISDSPPGRLTNGVAAGPAFFR